jgi:hypothetical protein
MCAAAEGLAAAMAPAERSVGWVVAPTYDLSDKVFREIVRLAGDRLRHRIVKLSEHDLRLGGEELRRRPQRDPWKISRATRCRSLEKGLTG